MMGRLARKAKLCIMQTEKFSSVLWGDAGWRLFLSLELGTPLDMTQTEESVRHGRGIEDFRES